MNLLVENWRPFSLGIVFGTLAFALYAEMSPGMGNVWIRQNDLGDKVVTLRGLGALMREPFKNREMWRPRNFDINYLVVATTSGFAGVAVAKLIALL